MRYLFSFQFIAGTFLFLWLLGKLSFLGWISDLASHFQVQYFVGLLLLFLFACLRRLWLWLLPLGVALFLTGSACLPYFHLNPQKPVTTHLLRIMQINVLLKSKHYSKVAEAIRKYQPDILSLQEVDALWLSKLSAELRQYPYHLQSIRSGRIYGLALYSKLPLQSPSVVYYQNSMRPSLQAEIEFQLTPICLVAMHPYSPGKYAGFWWRNQQLLAFAQQRHLLNEHLILIGDLNITPFSSHFQRFLEMTGLTDTRIGHGYLPTWHTAFPAFSIPIDHILTSSRLKVSAFKAGPFVGSDHFPLIADISISE